MTTDTLSPLNPSRVEYSLSDVYNAVEARLNKASAEVAALTVDPDKNYVAAMMVSRKKALQDMFEVVSAWKAQGVKTLVSDRPVCDDGNLGYKPGCDLVEQIKSRRLSPFQR